VARREGKAELCRQFEPSLLTVNEAAVEELIETTLGIISKA
jgi:hypothetical protein